jgi:hypothetical protein
MRAWEAAIQILIETDNPAVMYGDEWLCHQIATRLGWEHAGPETSRRVLRALSKTPGRLVKGLVRMPGDCCARGQSALHFELPKAECDFMLSYQRQGKKPDWTMFGQFEVASEP